MPDGPDPKELEKTVAELRKQLSENQTLLQTERKAEEEIRAILEEFVAKRRKHLAQIELAQAEDRRLKYKIQDAERQFTVAKAEAERIKALQPHFDHPRLQFVLKILERHPKFGMLKQYQKEDLTFMIDRYLFPLKTKGVMNGNDTGLGKTAETAFVLWSLEVFEKLIKLGKVPQEVIDPNYVQPTEAA
jgi:hypothetical protein